MYSGYVIHPTGSLCTPRRRAIRTIHAIAGFMASEEGRDGASMNMDASEGGDDGSGRDESTQQANRR